MRQGQCVGSPSQEKVSIDGHETQQGSAIGTSKVLQPKQIIGQQLKAEVQAGCKSHQKQGSPPSTAQQNLEMPWYLPRSRQAVRVNH